MPTGSSVGSCKRAVKAAHFLKPQPKISIMRLLKMFANNEIMFMVLCVASVAFMLYAGHAVYLFLKDEATRQQERYNGDDLGSWQDDFFPPANDN